jgi:hypothetical protein
MPNHTNYNGLCLSVAVCCFIFISSDLCLADPWGVRFNPPHIVKRSLAQLEPKLLTHVDHALTKSNLSSLEDVLRFSLTQTGARLHFGLKHKTKLGFGLAEREANCVEYAQLFVSLFNRACGQKGLKALAYPVRSANVRVLGQRLPFRGWGDHDWVLIVSHAEGKRWYVDPTLADAGLGWDIGSSVTHKETLRPR